MREIITYLYTYDELSARAKEQAREEFRVHNLEGWDWSADITDDAERIGALMGIEIDKIYFSGFYSQGDGACFTGTYKYQKDSVKKVKQYAPEDEVLHEIVEELDEMQQDHFFQLTAKITHGGRYYHSNSVRIKAETTTLPPECQFAPMAQTLRRFMDWIYQQLEKEYEYLQADDAIAETLISNGYEFNEGGILT